MSWQEALRRLDADLASGRISLHEHRKQRDELLAEASSGVSGSVAGTASGVSPEPVAASPAPAPSTQPSSKQPPPAEPPQWPTTPLPQKSNASALLSTTVPTSAPSPADERATESIPYPSLTEAPTVVMPPVGPLPSLNPPPTAPPPAEPQTQSRRVPTWLFVSLGVLVVIALIGGSTWWLSSRHGGAPPNPAPTKSLEDRLPALPGTPDPNNLTVAVDRGAQLGLYPQQAGDVFTRNGVESVVYRGSTQGDNVYFVLAIPAADPAKAAAIVAYLHAGALSGGSTALAGHPNAVTGTNGSRMREGTWYASGNVAVAIWVSQPANGQPAQLTQLLDQTEGALRAALPPH